MVAGGAEIIEIYIIVPGDGGAKGQTRLWSGVPIFPIQTYLAVVHLPQSYPGHPAVLWAARGSKIQATPPPALHSGSMDGAAITPTPLPLPGLLLSQLGHVDLGCDLGLTPSEGKHGVVAKI